jgi:hypothetical protein
MEINAVLGAVFGAIVGAIAWAAIAAYTGYEVGIIAWGVGGLVGLGAFLLEGRGATSGIVCAVLAVLAILAGKYMALHSLNKQGLEMLTGEQGIMRGLYDETLADAAAFALVQSEADYPAFMVDHGYVEVESVQEVTQWDVDAFKEESVPMLREWAASPPSYEAWQQQSGMNEATLSVGFVESLGPIDVIFFVLGIGTAFRIGSGGEYE